MQAVIDNLDPKVDVRHVKDEARPVPLLSKALISNKTRVLVRAELLIIFDQLFDLITSTASHCVVSERAPIDSRTNLRQHDEDNSNEE